MHAKISVKKFGGAVDDYIKIHNWFDQTKGYIPDARHRMLLHNSFGIMLCEQQFGVYIINSDDKDISVRDIAEQHVVDDLGIIPTLCETFKGVKIPSEIKSGKLLAKIKAGNFVIVD